MAATEWFSTSPLTKQTYTESGIATACGTSAKSATTNEKNLNIDFLLTIFIFLSI